jgi:hypothetical protein
MKKRILTFVLPILLLTLSAAALHKYHMALYQINYAPEKKMLQITGRIHIDDLNKALEKKYKKKIAVESEKDRNEDIIAVKDYLSNQFKIKVNGQMKTLNFLSKEIEGDEVVYYWNIKEITKISSIEIHNSILTDFFSDQQNLINITVLGVKNSFLLTNSTLSKTLKY